MKKVAVVGAGHWGKNLVRTFYELGALGAVVEASETLREIVKQQYPNVPVFDSVDVVKESHSIDGIVIATPAFTHYDLAKQCLLSGKDVFIEKPMTLSGKDGEELVNTARENQRILMVGHLLMYQPAIQEMKRVIDAGGIGRVVTLHQQRLKLGIVRSVENVLWSFGVHDLAVFLYLVGEEPVDMNCTGQNIIQPSIEDDVYLHLTFPNGVKAHLHTSWLYPEVVRKLTIIGTEGMLVYDELAQSVALHKKGVRKDLSIWGDGSEIIFQGENQPLKIECEHFLHCMETRTTPMSDGANGVAVLKILERASNKEGV
ncbi:Gfo/Idh/MocA family protein [Paenibacillus allorhizosphaerae]|uniref:Scyllo-inositol 2-dehydrogenase (NAD(+)) n=1 Tax=Paenibacillus allorhizosphaerae TaxID=2849866 RepID=A0ABN7TYU3_9BACL|nr:Gfo/Idh/MocA family oxidoreductase [Paenibacillus allorhizosphaerae]CAG7656172.1 scyllo-inositol 2-dehydrogenase (NAD(+)) [Paenibacillus allorhizosphaerae]